MGALYRLVVVTEHRGVTRDDVGKEVRLTLLRLHLCDFLEPVPPRLTITWFVGLAKTLPVEMMCVEVINREGLNKLWSNKT